MREIPRVDRHYVAKLIAISLIVILGVFFYTRGTGVQLNVEGKLPEVRNAAQAAGVPVRALIALCVCEGFMEEGSRSPKELARGFQSVLVTKAGDLEAAFHAFLPAPHARLALDLMHRNESRWQRLLSSL